MRQRNERRHQLFAQQMQEYLSNRSEGSRLHLEGPGTESLAAWFIGPRGENASLFNDMISQAIQANTADRNTLYPNDPPYITGLRRDTEYFRSVQRMVFEYEKLLNDLKGSVPFFSYRYQAHMNWDLTMPSMAGYFAAMLYNQNNVALEASPVTSNLEKIVGDDLCRMLGFEVSDYANPRPWGHITCDGSVANLEAMWAARNAKFYAFSVKAALENESSLAAARHITVRKCSGEPRELISMDPWELMNLTLDSILEIPTRLQAEYHIPSATVTDALDPYLLQTMGIAAFFSKFLSGQKAPTIMGPATKHYSWPKNAALTGLGKDCYQDIHVDQDARMDCADLDHQLGLCVKAKQPVVMVVVVLGSTEESAVDPLAEVVKLRKKYRAQGLDFAIHVDGAWGGYFASILRIPNSSGETEEISDDLELQPTPALSMSKYVTEQYLAIPEADSVTIDPHKAGYVPYAAGGLCYRNGAMRNLVAFLAPEVYHGSTVDSNMGVYGVEGSKPGAAAAGVYLSHRVIRPDRSGYGKILGQALFNSKRFYSAIVTLAKPSDSYVVVPVQQIPAEKAGGTPAQIQAQLDMIKQRIVDKQNSQIMADTEAVALLKELGSDQIIITYGLNFKRKGVLNTDPGLANSFMQDVFTLLSLQANKTPPPDLIVTTSEFDPDTYGESFVQTFMKRLGLSVATTPVMHFLSSTTMCPWLTATKGGNFIPTLATAFDTAVKKVLEDPKYR